jgi:5-amino-6-(5-phospho-D-ribitylamino)uracil phosphatase
MIRFIALDIDGTLLDTRWQVPEANRDAIRRATDAGVEVALVTGRRFDFARPVIEQIDAPLTLIVSGGALVKTRNGETLIRHLLPVEAARAVVEGTKGYRDATAVVFDRPRAAQVVHERLDIRDAHRRSYFERNRGYIVEVVPLEAALTEDPIQVMFSGGVRRMREVAACVRGLDAAPQVAIAVTEYESRNFSLVDVNGAGCTKGSTLAEWVARQGIARDEVLAIGDNFNDWEMLEFAGTAVVMGNAVPELKALGWPVTLDNDAAGVAAAIDRYALSGSDPDGAGRP